MRKLLLALALGPLLVAGNGPARAEEGRSETTLPAARRGVHVAGIDLYTATYAEIVGEGEKQAVRVTHGDLESVRWKDGVLPVLDAQLVLANLTNLRLVDLPVKVSVHFGLVNPTSMPLVVAPGAAGVREEVFFERTFQVEELLPLGLGRVALRDIQLARAVEEYARQKIWPAYVRVEAVLEKVPSEVDLITPRASAYLRIEP